MKIVQFEGKQITGIGMRTNNANEMNPETSRIATIHQKFDKKVSVNYKNGARVYGVYYDYESDYSGEFSVLAGTDQSDIAMTGDLEKISIPGGKYMVFEAKGEVPQIVIETWSKIWSYFSKGDTQYQRAYITDFEFYKNQNELEIYISVK